MGKVLITGGRKTGNRTITQNPVKASTGTRKTRGTDRDPAPRGKGSGIAPPKNPTGNKSRGTTHGTTFNPGHTPSKAPRAGKSGQLAYKATHGGGISRGQR